MYLDSSNIDFQQLVIAIRQVHDELAAQACRAVNSSLTLRNWLIGLYIREYEQHGADRAQYGEALLERLSAELRRIAVPRSEARELRRYRLFYSIYPQIREALTPEFHSGLLRTKDMGVDDSQLSSFTHINGQILISKLSFTHFVELIMLEDADKRLFYEAECIQGNWTVRELKRQISSLYYERSILSHNKQKLAALTQENSEEAGAKLIIRDPYVFEFLGLRSREAMSESQLEDQLIDKIEDFLLELGHGFCFEARQQRILIGDEQFFIDLVFYHRILKCHVLVELKLQKFNHENIGQLNTYVSWFRKNIMMESDNPPIGILLCTDKNHALVEYALAGMDNNLFVSKYLLELPHKKAIQAFIEEQVKNIEDTRNV